MGKWGGKGKASKGCIIKPLTLGVTGAVGAQITMHPRVIPPRDVREVRYSLTKSHWSLIEGCSWEVLTPWYIWPAAHVGKANSTKWGKLAIRCVLVWSGHWHVGCIWSLVTLIGHCKYERMKYDMISQNLLATYTPHYLLSKQVLQ